VLVTIKFEGRHFHSLVDLAEYIAAGYGSWAGVPEDHPDRAVVDALCILNTDYYVLRGSASAGRYWIEDELS
jgi:hypothetical protein